MYFSLVGNPVYHALDLVKAKRVMIGWSGTVLQTPVTGMEIQVSNTSLVHFVLGNLLHKI